MKLQQEIDRVTLRLRELEEQQFDHLSFDWEGIHFRVTSEQTRSNTAQIHLQANLGRLYFTIENAANRAKAIERLYANNRRIDGAYSVDSNGQVLFQCITRTNDKLVGKDLIVALTTILLQTKSHLTRLRSHLKAEPIAA